MPYERALNQIKASLPRCKTMLRRAVCRRLRAAGFRVANAIAPLRWLSVGRRCSTFTCDAHPPYPAGYDRPRPYKRAIHQRKITCSRCKAVLRRARSGLERAAGFRVAHASAPLQWLPVGRRQSTHACDARAPCRADCNRSVPCVKVLHRRQGCLTRCTTALRRVRRGLLRAAGFRVALASARAALAVCGEEAQHARLRRTRAIPR